MDTWQIGVLFATIAVVFGLATINEKVMRVVMLVLAAAGLITAVVVIASAVRLMSAGINPFQ